MNPEARAALEALENEHGELTSEAVEAAARASDSPLHEFFDWNDTTAAQSHRLEQARKLIQRYRVTFIGARDVAKSVRGYTSVKRPTAEGGERRVFVRTEVVLTNEELRAQLVSDLRRDIAALRSKYGHMEEFREALLAVADAANV